MEYDHNAYTDHQYTTDYAAIADFEETPLEDATEADLEQALMALSCDGEQVQ